MRRLAISAVALASLAGLAVPAMGASNQVAICHANAAGQALSAKGCEGQLVTPPDDGGGSF